MPRLGGYYIFFIMGAATLTARAVLDSSFRNSTLLYILIPFAISIALHLALPVNEGDTPLQRFGSTSATPRSSCWGARPCCSKASSASCSSCRSTTR